MEINVSIVDNDPIFLSIISDGLMLTETKFVATSDTNQFLDSIKEPCIPIIDFYLDYGITGVDILKRLLQKHILLHPIFISSLPSVEQMLEIADLGCPFFYVRKDKSDFIAQLKAKIEKAQSSMRSKINASYEKVKRWEEFKQHAQQTIKVLDGNG